MTKTNTWVQAKYVLIISEIVREDTDLFVFKKWPRKSDKKILIA